VLFKARARLAAVQLGLFDGLAPLVRFSRKRHDSGFPRQALPYRLRQGGIGLGEVDFVAFYDKPFLQFERLVEAYLV
jgi:carbamoyltransferase